jgi:hypothetical protein
LGPIKEGTQTRRAGVMGGTARFGRRHGGRSRQCRWQDGSRWCNSDGWWRRIDWGGIERGVSCIWCGGIVVKFVLNGGFVRRGRGCCGINDTAWKEARSLGFVAFNKADMEGLHNFVRVTVEQTISFGVLRVPNENALVDRA